MADWKGNNRLGHILMDMRAINKGNNSPTMEQNPLSNIPQTSTPVVPHSEAIKLATDLIDHALKETKDDLSTEILNRTEVLLDKAGAKDLNNVQENAKLDCSKHNTPHTYLFGRGNKAPKVDKRKAVSPISNISQEDKRRTLNKSGEQQKLTSLKSFFRKSKTVNDLKPS